MKRADKQNEGISRRGLFGLACSACAAGLAAGFSEASQPAAVPGTSARRGLLGFKRSPWFAGGRGQEISCELCPRSCSISEGKRGFCRVRGNWRGEGYTLVYGNPVIVQIDPIERKPFYHVLPASRSLSVATAGCNVRCKFCEVWDMALVAPDDVYAYDLPPEKTAEHALESGVESISFTFGEPVVFFEYMYDTAKKAAEKGIPSLFHSNGYIQQRPLKKLCEVVDGVNIDLKAFDEEFYRKIVGGRLQPVLDNMKELRKEGKHMEVTNLVIPTLNDDIDDIRKMCRWIKEELGPDTPLHLNRFYPLYKLANLPPTPVSTLEEARAAGIEEGLQYVYIGNVTGHQGQHTFCPECGKELIHRVGFMIDEPRMSEGRCNGCGHEVPGIWK